MGTGWGNGDFVVSDIHLHGLEPPQHGAGAVSEKLKQAAPSRMKPQPQNENWEEPILLVLPACSRVFCVELL